MSNINHKGNDMADKCLTYEFTDGRDAQHFATLSRVDGATATVRKMDYNPQQGSVWTVTIKGRQEA